MHYRNFRYVLPIVGLLSLGACSTDSSASAKTGAKVFKFSAIPNQDQAMLTKKYQPVAEYLSKELGIEVKYDPAADYSGSVTKLVNGDIDMAWFGGFTGVDARERIKGATAIAKGEKDANYVSYFIANPKTGLKKSDSFPKEIEGKTFTFGSKKSTSGRLMPQFFIKENTGKSPEEFFKTVNFSGAHDKTIELVKNGSFEVGVVDFGVYDSMVKEGKLKPEECPIIWTTPTYADYQFTVNPDLDKKFGAGFSDKLRKALLAMNPELAGKFGRKKMVPAKNTDFDGIKKTAQDLKLLK